MQLAAEEVAHGGRAPAHEISDAELIEKLEGRPVGLAHEVIEALDRQAAEIEMRRHAAWLRRGLEHADVVPSLGRVIGGGKAHGACADHGYARFAMA